MGKPLGKAIRPLTDEEKKRMVIKELMDKRERFALNILHGLCQNPDSPTNDNDLIDRAVNLADKLLEKLYPIKDEEDKEK